MTTTHSNKIIDRPEWLTEESWPYQIRTVQVDGETIAYTDEGEGPTLLLVHDGMWSYVWGQLIDRLRHQFRIVTLDFPGSGLSPDTGYPISLEADSRLLESFVDQLALTEVTLVLHDLGGSVGTGVAARRPGLVRGLVMVNTFAWPPHVASLKRMLRLVSSEWFTWLNIHTNLVPRLTSGRFGIGANLPAPLSRAFLGGFRREGSRLRFHRLLGAALAETGYLAGIEHALQTTLSDQPVLTIFGERNDPFGFQARFRELFPKAEEMVIPGGNHFPMCDDPDGVANRIAGWHRRWAGI